MSLKVVEYQLKNLKRKVKPGCSDKDIPISRRNELLTRIEEFRRDYNPGLFTMGA